MEADKCSNPPPPIAIVGMGMRLPGGISTPEQFWDLLTNKRDGKCQVPKGRYSVEAFHGQDLSKNAVASDQGYFLQDLNLKAFDAPFFSMKKSEVELLDPQQRLLLEAIWECMERAGQTNWRGTNIGCYVGSFGEDWHDQFAMDAQDPGFFKVTGSTDFNLANRVSYEYDLKGPSMTIRTACSSSLYCLHVACQSLYSGDCSAAIVAGTSLILNPYMTQALTDQNVLSPTGCCKTFDANANGFVRGEAVTAVLIKRLDDAIRDGDPIRAVIRSTAINSDGKTPGLTHPSLESQENMIRRAYEVAGVDVSETAYVECHGTGTQTGDGIETTAIANVFGEHGLYIGSVKPNLGHAEGASGLVGLIKTTLALEKNIIPPNINFDTPNPKIPFKKGKLIVPVENTPWPKDRLARAGVSSFGIGGANAHVIVESAASFGVPIPKAMAKVMPSGILTEQRGSHGMESVNGVNGLTNGHHPTAERTTNGFDHVNSQDGAEKNFHLIPISANNSQSLQLRAQVTSNYIQSHANSIDSIAYTLGECRDHLSHRAFSIASGEGPATFQGFQGPRSSNAGIVFVFTGQGAQWALMGKELIQSLTSFREDIREMDRTLQSLADPPQWSIEELLCSTGTAELIQKPEYSQPLSTAVQIALVHLLNECGVTPTAVVGHSSGEIAAAYAAKAITATEAISISYYRGLITGTQTRKGGMMAIGMGRDAVSPYLVDGVVVGCDNSPRNVTLSGDEVALEQTLEALKSSDPDIFARRLRVNAAYHSYHMCEITNAYDDMLKHKLLGGVPEIPFYSAVMGKLIIRLEPDYWRRSFESTVLFNGAVQNLLDDYQNNITFLEIGPHSALHGPLRDIFQQYTGNALDYVPTLVRNSNSTKSLLTTLGELYTRGWNIDFSCINLPGTLLTDLPNYPWDHNTEYWKESPIALAWRMKKHPSHELLGSRCLESTDIEPAWRISINPYDVSWLRDHKVGDDVIFPCAGYIAMMGEAIRQLTGTDTYSLRNLVIKAAIVMQDLDSAGTEITTTMRPSRLTDSDNSSWYDFSISSFNGVSWIQHCTAQGKPEEENPVKEKEIAPYPRRLSEGFWYERLRHLGLNYGPRFQGMTAISAHTAKEVATASIRNDESRGARYTIHPTTLDNCLQLFTVAMTNGIARRLDKLALPSSVQYICVKPGDCPELLAEATTQVSSKGVVTADLVAITKLKKPVIILKNGALTPFSMGDQKNNVVHAAARLEWQPHVDFINPSDLITRAGNKRDIMALLNKFTALCILQTLENLASLEISVDHLVQYSNWLREEKDLMSRGEWASTVPEAQQWMLLDAAGRKDQLNLMSKEIQAHGDKEAWGIASGLRKICESDNVRALFSGHTNPIELLSENGSLSYLYKFIGNMVNAESFFALCAHTKPNLKILEIGAGTGGATEEILQTLGSQNGVRMYSEYVFTDISSGFFANAKERFKEFGGITFQVLDISKDPAQQGFELGSFDIIVASNVLHATPSLHETLKNARSLLRPNGRLFLQELIQPMRWRFVHFMVGVFVGWWLGGEDNRPDQPIVSVERWEHELLEAGFSGIDAVIFDDDDESYHLNGVIISSAIEPTVSAKSVVLLYNTEKHSFALDLASQLEREGYSICWRKLTDQVDLVETADWDIISTIDLEGPYLDEVSEKAYNILISYISSMRSGILWLTRSSQMECDDPRYGLITGFARCIRTELSLDFATMELQVLDSKSVSSVAAVFQKFRERSSSANFDPEAEYVLHSDVIHVARYRPVSVVNELEEVLRDDEPKHLKIGQFGQLSSLAWAQKKSTKVKPGEVEVEIHYVGLNFRDVLTAMGIVEGGKDPLGLEASGIITQVGSEVNHLKVGDRAVLMLNGCLTTRVVIPSQNVIAIPEELSLKDAATMPVVYTTVIHAVINLGQLITGQSILIHSACGGVGLAALQICKMLGAEIYATVGSEEKVQYLMKNFDIPRDRIFNSRNISFLEDTLEATQGRGVDVVLNSLSGELLHASWECVAKYGKMLEIGKRDFIGHGKLSLDIFEANRTFFGIDLGTIAEERPEVTQRLLQQMLGYFQQGHINPIRPIVEFSAPHAEKAFRHMQNGQHIGKIIIKVSGEVDQSPSFIKAPRQYTFSNVSTFLLVGGLGGLGKALTTWMVEHGARSFVFLSPSAGTSILDQQFFRELESQGCRTVAIAGSVAKMEDVERAIKAAPTPISGVFQMSMVLRDLPLLQMGHKEWVAAQDPKVRGTWNLHKALLGSELSFFVLFSSISGAFGQPGQANYASANTFLDSFSQYRHNLNLPCSVIDIGIMEGVGFVSKNMTVLNQQRLIGCQMLQEQALLDSIQISIDDSLSSSQDWSHRSYSNHRQLLIGLGCNKPLSDPSNRILWKRDIRTSIYWQLESNNKPVIESSKGAFREFLNFLPTNPQSLEDPENVKIVTNEISHTVCGFMMWPEEEVNEATSLTSMGVDSLVSVEIRNWYRRILGVDVSVLGITTAGTVGRLGELAIASLQKKYNQAGKSKPDVNGKGISLNAGSGAFQDEMNFDLPAKISAYTETPWDLQGLMAHPISTLRERANVFLTGATGYLGTQILQKLIRSDKVDRVVVLVRARSVQHGLDRVKETAEMTDWWSLGDEEKLEIWVGDLAKKDLGLSPEQFLRLQGESVKDPNVDAIIHNGAVVNWSTSYENLQKINVDVNVDLLRIAAVSPSFPKYIYVSGGIKKSTYPSESAFIAALSKAENGYFQTKAVSEGIVQEIVSRLPTEQNRLSIVKPGLILGAGATGIANIDDILWRLVGTATILHKYPIDPATAWLPLVGADTVAETIVSQLFNTGAIPPFIDMLNGLLMNDLWSIVNEELWQPCASIEKKDWIQLAMDQIDEAGRKHPMWALQDYLSYEKWLADAKEGFTVSETLKLNLRNSVQHLQRIGYIRSSVEQEVESPNERIMKRSAMA